MKFVVQSPFFATLVVIGLAACFLFGPIFRGDVPLPTRSIPGITWGQPNQPAQASIFRDRIVQAYPYHLFATTLIQAGHFPAWNNLIFNGTTFFANGQAGVLSLLKLPFWWLPAWLSYSIITVLQSLVAGLGLFILGRKLGWKSGASIVAGLVLTLSAPFVMRLTVTTMSAVIACLPWVLWGILRLHEQLSWKNVTLLSALIATMIFAGHVQLAAFCLVYAIFWTAIWWRKRDWKKRTTFFLIAFALGLGLTSIQLVPVKESLAEAYRQPGHRPWSQVLNPKRLFHIDVKQSASLATLVTPNMLGNEAHYRGPGNYLEGNLFIGPIALILIIMSHWARRQRLWKWLITASVFVGGFYVFPGWWDLMGNIAPWITVTPVWRTSFMFIFSLSLLVGFGAQFFLTKRPRATWHLIILTAVTMLWLWQGILPFAPRSSLFPKNPLLDQAVIATSNGATLWTPNGALDQFMPYNIPVAMGYDSVYPKQYLELWSDNAELRLRNQLHVKDPSPQLLAVSGANVLLTSDSVPKGWTTVTTSGYWKLASKDNPVAPIHTVKSLIPEVRPDQVSSINPATSALVVGTVPEINSDSVTTIDSVERTPTKLQLRVTSSGTTAVVTNWQSYPGWKLLVDGKEDRGSLLRVNHAFLGAVVNEGIHEVIFVYQPRSYVVGLVVSIASLVILIAGFWLLPKKMVR